MVPALPPGPRAGEGPGFRAKNVADAERRSLERAVAGGDGGGKNAVPDFPLMRDIELYRHLLGLEQPWIVMKVALDVKEQRVDVWVDHGEGLKWPCPACDRKVRTTHIPP